MAKKLRYYYDAEDCEFKEEQVSLKSIFKRISIDIVGALFLSAIFVFGYFSLSDDPVISRLKDKVSTLTTKIDEYHGRVAALENKVDGLHEEDRRFRSQLNKEVISDGIWEGGFGGSVENVTNNHPEILKETERKLEALDYKVDLQDKSYDFLFKTLEDKEIELRHVPAIKPVPGRVISGFGVRKHPILKIKKMHTGLDFVAPMGTPVYATGDGVVKYVGGGKRNGYGIHIDLDHGYGYITKYAHLSKFSIKKGQRVKRGDVIGYTGSTGLSKGPHLHYEIIKNGKKVNPIDNFYGDQTPEEYVQMRQDAAKINESMD